MNSQEGKKEIPDYFWDYAKSKGWEEKGKALLKEEESNTSFRSLHEARESVPADPDLPAMDLMEVRQEMGAFFEPGRGEASLKVVESAKDPLALEIHYDVRQRYTYSGVSIRFDDLGYRDRYRFGDHDGLYRSGRTDCHQCQY